MNCVGFCVTFAATLLAAFHCAFAVPAFGDMAFRNMQYRDTVKPQKPVRDDGKYFLIDDGLVKLFVYIQRDLYRQSQTPKDIKCVSLISKEA